MAHSTHLPRVQKNLRALLVLKVLACTLILLPGPLLAAESKEGFGLQNVINKAQDLAKKPFQERQTLVPEFLTKLKYDEWRDIRFDPEQALWLKEKLPFTLQFFHPGLYYIKTVNIYTVDAAAIQPVPFSGGPVPHGLSRCRDGRGLPGRGPGHARFDRRLRQALRGLRAAESGRDYATTTIPENELRNVHLRRFQAAVDAGVATLMASFSDLNGVPATANGFLMRQVLRDEWGFDGFVFSDWDSVRQLAVLGLTSGDRDSAREASSAGVDMEMAGDAFSRHLAGLVGEGRVDIEVIDRAVANILRIKFRLGLFENPYVDPTRVPATSQDEKMRIAKTAALQSVVLRRTTRACSRCRPGASVRWP